MVVIKAVYLVIITTESTDNFGLVSLVITRISVTNYPQTLR